MRALVALAFCTCALAAPAFVGSSVCGGCHADVFARQSKSAHASALSRASERTFPPGSLNRGPSYRFALKKDGVRIEDGANVMDLPLEWAFGAGRQAVTFVTRVNQDWYVEHYASYYPALRGYRATPGQDALHPASVQEAAGVLYKIADPQTGIAGCFECHSTGPVSFDGSGQVRLTEPGVHCEACHGAGSEHARDPVRHRLQNPRTISAVKLNEFCGRCHRPPGPNIDWNYAWNVRHAPVYLSQSQCFRKSKGGLTCLTCHDPHDPVGARRLADYNARCLDCHQAHGDSANCVDCHMPLVSPQSPLRFTNHWIGVYRTGSKLKPVR